MLTAAAAAAAAVALWASAAAAAGAAAGAAPAQPATGASLVRQATALRLGIADLIATFGAKYPGGAGYLAELDAWERRPEGRTAGELADLRRRALLNSPLLDFDELLVLRRSLGRRARAAMGGELGVGTLNAHTNDSLRRTGWDNEVAALGDLRGGSPRRRTVFRPGGTNILADVVLHFDADRLLFSSIGAQGNWRIFEVGIDGGAGLRQLTPDDGADVGHFDACYLPDGRIIFDSTAPYLGLPCEFGGRHMASLYLLDPATGAVRQLTFEQDSDWCPTPMNDGRVLYQRWEYADLPHSHSRRLFSMNPDGTGQAMVYGTNGYFPNSFFYARPIPGHPTKIVGIAGGHHGTPRSGRLLILDPSRGRSEASGVVAEIPGFGRRVEAIVKDDLVDGVWPQFLHPMPLDERRFLVAMKPSPGALWGIYLADVFDNLVPIAEEEGAALLQPIPLRRTPRPPAVADRVDLSRRDATVHLADVYHGPGLAGVPRGTVKRLRVVAYHFSFRGTGGLLGSIGMDGPWDIKRVLGTVPVAEDGSATFTVPANTPLTVQPLDAEGKALQLMRSWFTAMPGETVTCGGCHEHGNAAAPAPPRPAGSPVAITPWRGPDRGFAFAREVQPALDRHCVSCHDGTAAARGSARTAAPDLRGTVEISDWTSRIAGNAGQGRGGRFSVAYAALHAYVRRPGIESDIHLLAPLEYHADTTELVQMLRKGHHGVELDAEAWDHLVTWIDLNAPYHGTWTEIVGGAVVAPAERRAHELAEKYALGILDRTEAGASAPPAVLATPPAPGGASARAADVAAAPPAEPEPTARGFPFDAAEARRRQRALGGATTRTLTLPGGVPLALVRIPPGAFVMGSGSGAPDERPHVVEVRRAFWVGATEVTNRQFRAFDPGHDSHVESLNGYQFGVHGIPLDGPEQPAVRVSARRADAFCRWLSAAAGIRAALPTEAQWEWACRAGSGGRWSYGGEDFALHANLADAALRRFAIETYLPLNTLTVIEDPSRYDDWIPKDARFDDGAMVTADVGRYLPNAWGLFDAHGNAAEWTRSAWAPYPYREDDGRNDGASAAERAVRGGSWYDRPHRATSGYRRAHRPYQKVFDVGFRIVVEE